MKPRDVLQLFLLSAVWGVSFLLIKVAGTAFPPLWVALLRLAFGASFLWTVLRLGGHRLPPRRLLGPLLLVALFNNAIPFSFFAWGEQSVPSNVAAVLNATTPIWTLLIAFGVREAPLSGRAVFGVVLGFLGVALALSGGFGQEAVSGFGVTVIALASLSYAVATTLAKRLLVGLDPIGLATTQLSLAVLLLLPVTLFGPPPGAVSVGPLSAVLVLGMFGSGIAYLLFYNLLARLSSTQVSAVTYLLPVWGLFWGGTAGEHISWRSLMGVCVVLVGLTLLNRPVRRGPEATT